MVYSKWMVKPIFYPKPRLRLRFRLSLSCRLFSYFALEFLFREAERGPD